MLCKYDMERLIDVEEEQGRIVVGCPICRIFEIQNAEDFAQAVLKIHSHNFDFPHFPHQNIKRGGSITLYRPLRYAPVPITPQCNEILTIINMNNNLRSSRARLLVVDTVL